MDVPTVPVSIQMELPLRGIPAGTSSSSRNSSSLIYCRDSGFTTKAAYEAHVADCDANSNQGVHTDVTVPARSGTLISTAIAGHQTNESFPRSQAAHPRTGNLDPSKDTSLNDENAELIKVDGNAETEAKLPLWCDVCDRGFQTQGGLGRHLDTSKDHKREMIRLFEARRLPANRKRMFFIKTMIECRICNKEFKDDTALLSHCQTSEKHKAVCLRAGVSYLSQITTTIDGKVETKRKLPSFWCEICDRGFPSENTRKTHFETSEDHRREVQKLKLEASGLPDKFSEYSSLPWCQICKREFRCETEFLSHCTTSAKHRRNASKLQLDQWRAAPKVMQQVKDVMKNSRPSHDRAVSGDTAESLDMSEEYVSIDHLHGKYACKICEREFFRYDVLEGHVRSSGIHKKEVKKRKQAASWVPAPGCGDRNQFPYRDDTDRFAAFSEPNDTLGRERYYEGKYWSFIPKSERQSELEVLKAKCHTLKDLKDFNYLVRPYGPDDYAALQKCKNCSRQRSRLKPEAKCLSHPGKKIPMVKDDGTLSEHYSCCGARGQGCIMMDVHDFLPPDPTLMQKYKEYQETPHFLWSDFTGGRIRKALILDCEMVGVQTPEGQKNELVLLCVADYFTGETLVNNLVRPSSRNVDWRTRYSGVTAADMDDAIKKGTALNGWMAARAKLWEMIDSETILIGHSLKNDLDILRIIHTKIIDSVILTSNAIGVSKSLHSPLQGLCKQLLGMTIQDHGLQGHICLEDVLATREVVIWCVENPSALAEWAQVVAEQERHKKEEMEKARKEKSEKQVLEKVEKRKRAESDALVKNASSKRVTGQVKGPTQGPGGVGGQASDTADAKTEDRLEQEGSREPKRLKPTTKTSDTDDSENLGLLSGRVFKNLTLRQATTDTPLPKPDSVPHLLD